MIYTIGNSHAHLFTDSRPGTMGKGENSNETFTSFSLGPVIAYNFFEHHYNSTLDVLRDSGVDKNKDFVMLVVGEVDCRWHLPYQAATQSRTFLEVTTECIDRFFRSIIALREAGYKVIGWGGHPTTTASHNDDPSQPIYGDCLDRNKITRIWDSYLGEKCAQYNIPYITIVEDLINEHNLTEMSYFSDYCHLDCSKTWNLIISKFIEQGIIL